MRFIVLCFFATLVVASHAAAQSELCSNPQQRCGRFVEPECLQRVGAGAVKAETGVLCDAQLDLYRECLKLAVEGCDVTANSEPPNATSSEGEAGGNAGASSASKTQFSVGENQSVELASTGVFLSVRELPTSGAQYFYLNGAWQKANTGHYLDLKKFASTRDLLADKPKCILILTQAKREAKQLEFRLDC